MASRLRDAHIVGAVPPRRDGRDPVDSAGDYAVQAINTWSWGAQGGRIEGCKAGLTAKAVQLQLGVDQPNFGGAVRGHANDFGVDSCFLRQFEKASSDRSVTSPAILAEVGGRKTVGE
jgi:hypothetical protein